MLRKDNTDLTEMVDSLKQKLHAKTVEFNRNKKKLEKFEKQEEEPQEEKKSAFKEALENTKINTDERRVILLKA